MSDEERQKARLDYFLGLATEEAGEVATAIGRAIRFGVHSPSTPTQTRTALDEVHDELGDLLAVIAWGIKKGLLSETDLFFRRDYKLRKLLSPDIKDHLGRPLAPE